MYTLHSDQRQTESCEFINSAYKYYTGKNDLTQRVTYREAVSGMVIHSIFDVWQYEV